MTAANAVEPGQPIQCLGFAVGDERCAVRIDAVREILEVVQMTPLPMMPAFLRGVMNLRGAVVPVVDLGARLGLGGTAMGRRTCVIIVDVALNDADGEHTGTQRLGVMVDAVHEVFDTSPSELEPVPRLGTLIDAGFIRHMVRLRGTAIVEIDLAKVLDRQALSALIAAYRTH